jgi:maltooligosyltrehalose trehalohydrolase
VVSAQNHDQVGNRAHGDRLSTLIPHEALKVAAATLLLGPNVPLLFMGEEYAETSPFLYFIDHGDPALIEAVRKGRLAEFASFGWDGDIPDPQSVGTFERSRLTRDGSLARSQEAMLAWSRALIALRTSTPAFNSTHEGTHTVWTWESERVLAIHRRGRDGSDGLLLLGFSAAPATLTLREPVGAWRRRLDAHNSAFGGDGSASSLATIGIAAAGTTVALPGYPAMIFVSS